MLTIDGLVDNPLKLSIADLKSKFEVVSRNICIECGGNGRAFFDPKAKGNQWSLGAVACAEWTGGPPGRRTEGSGRQVIGYLHRPLRRRLAPFWATRQAADLARRSDQEGSRSEQPHYLRHERGTDPRDERGATAASHAGLAGFVLPQVVQPHAAPRCGTRRAEDDRCSLPVAAAPGGPGYQWWTRRR